MRILVLGAGAVGGYFGGRLIEAGGAVKFLVRGRRAAALAAKGLVIRSPHGDVTVPVQTLTVGAAIEPHDVILIACKAYDLAGAVGSVAPAVGAKSLILPLLNGLKHLDELDARFGQERVLGGTAQIGATLSPDGAIVHFNDLHRLVFGQRRGRHDARLQALADLMVRAKFEARLSDAVMQDMWEKFVSLATQAGMTCLMRAAPGVIMRAHDGRALMLEFLDECARVATASGYGPRPAFLERARGLLTDPTSTFTASMLRDIERLGATEGDHVLGDMLRRARALDIATPLLRMAVCHLESYEAGRSLQGRSPSSPA